MINLIKFATPVITATILLSACGTTEMERRLENNFVYQCSKKLLDDVDKRISGDDAGKICAAAEKSELDQKTRNEISAPVTTPAPTAAPAKTSPAETDEVKPEPTPKN